MKILIGCPTSDRYEYCVDIWIDRVSQIISFSKEHQIDYLLADNSRSDNFFNKLKEKGVNIMKTSHEEDVKDRIVNSRNIIREKVLSENYDYFFSLEQDVIPPKNILSKLLGANKPIVTSYYGKQMGLMLQDKETGEIKKAIIELPLIYLQEGDLIRRANPPEIMNKGLIEIGACGIGCILISSSVLKDIKFKHEKGKKAFDDMLFCQDAKALGFKLFLDSDTRAEHLHKPWDEK